MTSYTMTATFTRELSDDLCMLGIDEPDPRLLVKQMVRELQDAYDGGVAGSFNIDTITIDGETHMTADFKDEPYLDGWRAAVANGSTQLGYDAWVAEQDKQKDDLLSLWVAPEIKMPRALDDYDVQGVPMPATTVKAREVFPPLREAFEELLAAEMPLKWQVKLASEMIKASPRLCNTEAFVRWTVRHGKEITRWTSAWGAL